MPRHELRDAARRLEQHRLGRAEDDAHEVGDVESLCVEGRRERVRTSIACTQASPPPLSPRRTVPGSTLTFSSRRSSCESSTSEGMAAEGSKPTMRYMAPWGGGKDGGGGGRRGCPGAALMCTHIPRQPSMASCRQPASAAPPPLLAPTCGATTRRPGTSRRRAERASALCCSARVVASWNAASERAASLPGAGVRIAGSADTMRELAPRVSCVCGGGGDTAGEGLFWGAGV